jgi:hypothetical protein
MNLVDHFQVASPHVEYREDDIISHYTYDAPPVVTINSDKSVIVEPKQV